MLKKNLTIRSYITKQDGLWVGVCIDLSLATQADSLEECRHQLEEQIESYLMLLRVKIKSSQSSYSIEERLCLKCFAITLLACLRSFT